MASWGNEPFDFTDDDGIRYRMDESRDLQSGRTIYTVSARRQGERRIERDTLDIPSFGPMDTMANDRVVLQERVEEIPAINLNWQHIRDDRIRSSRENQPDDVDIFQEGIKAIRSKIDTGEHLITPAERQRKLEADLKRQAAEEARQEALRQQILEKKRLEREKIEREQQELESCDGYGMFG